MFEYRTASHAIPAAQLYLFYLVLFLLYLFLLRGVKLTLLSAIIMLQFNQGFLLLIDERARIAKVLFILLGFLLISRARFTSLSKRETWVLVFAFIFMIFFYWNYANNSVSLLWASYQYYKYFIPVLLFFAIRGLRLNHEQMRYYANLIIKLMWFQAAFSVVKYLILGLRENIVGSISDTGGGIGVTYAICAVIIYWLIKGKEIKGTDWWFVLAALILPASSNKRAIWLIYPIILTFLLTRQINVKTLRKISLAAILLPVLIYFGFRLNPTFNPERKVWGSFDPGFAINFTFAYSGVSEEKIQGDLAQGRWGATMAVVDYVIRHPFTTESLLGYARTRAGRAEYEESDPTELGLMPGTMISGLGLTILRSGWPGTLCLIFMYINMIAIVQDKRARFVLIFYMLWDTIMYSGSIVKNPIHSNIFVLTVIIAQYECRRQLVYPVITQPEDFKLHIEKDIRSLQTR